MLREADRIRYAPPGAFRSVLTERVGAYLARNGLDPRSDPHAHREALWIMAWFLGSYLLLVVFAVNWWQGVIASLSLGLAMAAIPMAILHDAGHRAFSAQPWLNDLVYSLAGLLFLDGEWWRFKHNRLHHSFTNIAGADSDVDKAPLLRLTEDQTRRPYHAYQHMYAWLLYPFLQIAMFVSGVRFLVTGQIGASRFPPPRGWPLSVAIGTKLCAGVLFFVIPFQFRGDLSALLMGGCLLLASFTFSLVMSCVFQVEHCVDTSSFPIPDRKTGEVKEEWALCQLRGTANLAPQSRSLTAYTGGLNHHIEHHLLSDINHGHYRALAPIVQGVCDEFGFPYVAFPSLRSALVAHGRFLRRLGRSEDSRGRPSQLGPVGA